MTAGTGTRRTCAACGRQADTADLLAQPVLLPERGIRWLCVDRVGCHRRSTFVPPPAPRRRWGR
jgi:hypothetical protein